MKLQITKTDFGKFLNYMHAGSQVCDRGPLSATCLFFSDYWHTHKILYSLYKCLQLLMRAFHCYEPVERQIKFALLLASLSTYEIYYQLTEDSQDNMEEKVC